MVVSIEIFVSPACDRCAGASELIKRVIDDVGNYRLQWREVDVLDEIDYAVSIGVLGTPAIAFDGELVFSALPDVKALRRALKQHLNKKSD